MLASINRQINQIPPPADLDDLVYRQVFPGEKQLLSRRDHDPLPEMTWWSLWPSVEVSLPTFPIAVKEHRWLSPH